MLKTVQYFQYNQTIELSNEYLHKYLSFSSYSKIRYVSLLQIFKSFGASSVFSRKLVESEVPQHISLGDGTIDDLYTIIKDSLHIKNNLLLIIQKNAPENQYLYENIAKFNTASYTVNILEIVEGLPDIPSYVSTVITFKPNLIIAYGNARTIDLTKLIILKYLETTNNEPRYHLDWVSIPTTPEHDGIVSPFIFLDLNGKGEEFLGQITPPVAIIVDTRIIAKASLRYLSSGIGDLYGRLTSVWDWKHANRLRGEPISDFAAEVSSENIDILTKQLQGIHSGYETLPIIMKAMIIAGFLEGFAGDVRSSYGSEHMFAQALDAIEPGKALHGERVALGTIMMASLQDQDWKTLRKSLCDASLPVSAETLGYKNSSIIKALITAVKYPTNHTFYTILGPGLSEEAAIALSNKTGIIGGRYRSIND